MSYGFRTGSATRGRRQPKMGEDIMAVLKRALSADQPLSVQALRGRMPRSGLPSALNERAPVSLSNGEFEFTPEQIYGIGLHALATMRERDRPGYAGGGGNGLLGLIEKYLPVWQGVAHLQKAGERAQKVSEVVNDPNNIKGITDTMKAVTYVPDLANDFMEKVYPDIYKRNSSVMKAAVAPYKFIPDAYDTVDNLRQGNWVKGVKYGADSAKDVVEFLAPFSQGAMGKVKKIGWAANLASTVDGANDVVHDIQDKKYGKAAWDALKTGPDAYKTIDPLVKMGRTVAGAAEMPAAVSALAPTAAVLAAGGLGYFAGHELYEHSPQVRDGAAGILNSFMRRLKNSNGELSEDQKQEIDNAITNERLQQQKERAALNGNQVYANRIVSKDSDAGKSSAEKYGDAVGDRTASMLGISDEDSPELAAAKKAYADRRREEFEQIHFKQLQAAGIINTDGY